jgi:CRP/FNR family transcriptional regulator, cyclic AMP receptor protein
MDKRRYKCLHDLPLFSGTDNITFPMICRAAKKQVIKKGDILFNQGDPADVLFYIKEGNLKLVKITEAGEAVIIQIVGAGEMIGETALFRENIFSPTSAIALGDVKICSLSRHSFEQVIMNEPKIAFQIIKALGERLDDTWEKITQLNTQTTREKLISLFIGMAQEHGVPCREGTLINIRLTQQDIASMVGSSRVMVSQVIQKLIKCSYIARKNKFYVLKSICSF